MTTEMAGSLSDMVTPGGHLSGVVIKTEPFVVTHIACARVDIFAHYEINVS
jgi:hypothetical protein